MHLHLFIRHCYPSWNQIFEMADEIMLDLSINDPEFYHHLKTISTTHAKADRKVFDSSF